MRPKPIKVALALVATLVAVTASACGGGSSSTSSSPEVVSPHGAHYSYAVPSGFEETPGSFPGGETPKFLTLVVPDGTEGEGYLNAYEWTLGSAEKKYPTKRLLAFLDQQTQSFYTSEGAGVTPGNDETVAGHPAVCWKVDHFQNQTEGFVYADSCAIVAAPGTVVEQSCSWKPVTKARIQKGCEELRASLKVGTATE